MSRVIDINDLPLNRPIEGVSWDEYEQTLEAIGDGHIKVAYLDGTMELMSPLTKHEMPKKVIANLILVIAMEHQIPMVSLGSTTFRKASKLVGCEPDEAFYFGEVNSVKKMDIFDPAIHRAPDLWVEVDNASASFSREPIYAKLDVPELWRFQRGKLSVRLLSRARTYSDSKTSKVFPFLPIAEFGKFIDKALLDDELSTLLEFREWVCELKQ